MSFVWTIGSSTLYMCFIRWMSLHGFPLVLSLTVLRWILLFIIWRPLCSLHFGLQTIFMSIERSRIDFERPSELRRNVHPTLQKDPNKTKNILLELCQQFEQDVFEEQNDDESFPPTDNEVENNEVPSSRDSAVSTLRTQDVTCAHEGV